MPPLLSTIANAGRHGVLVKSAVALEEFGTTDLVAFDKTGHAHRGHPAGLRDRALRCRADQGAPGRSSPLPPSDPASTRSPARSSPPLMTLDVAVPHSEEFGSTPGLRGDRTGGRAASGSVPRPPRRPTWRRAAQVRRPAPWCSELEEAGRTAVAVIADGVPVGVLALADRVRPGAREVVCELRR